MALGTRSMYWQSTKARYGVVPLVAPERHDACSQIDWAKSSFKWQAEKTNCHGADEISSGPETIKQYDWSFRHLSKGQDKGTCNWKWMWVYFNALLNLAGFGTPLSTVYLIRECTNMRSAPDIQRRTRHTARGNRPPLLTPSQLPRDQCLMDSHAKVNMVCARCSVTVVHKTR